MKKFLTIATIFACACTNAFAEDSEVKLSDKIKTARDACSGISEEMSGMKKIAGINTALTSVGTAGGVVGSLENIVVANQNYIETDKKIAQYSLGTTAVTDAAGAVLAVKNHIDDELQQHIDNCIAAVDDLRENRLRARAENTATPEELATAQVIEIMCADWKNVDLSSIDKRATGAAISGGTGAALATAGAITSAKNKDDDVKLDNTATALGLGATVASTTAIVFNAKQKSAIKKAIATAEKCEEGITKSQESPAPDSEE